MTAFTDVQQLNRAFGLEYGAKAGDWEFLENYVKNIFDEYEELLEAIAAKDVKEVRDALCDINVFSMGGHHHIGHDADADMKAVSDSNMSKFIPNDDVMEATIKKYADLGVVVVPGGEYPIKYVVCEYEQVGNGGETYRANKRLKGVLFKEPVFA